MNPLNAYLALEIINDRVSDAEHHRLAHTPREREPLPRYDAVQSSGVVRRIVTAS